MSMWDEILEFKGSYKIKMRDESLPRIHRLVGLRQDSTGRVVYLIDDEDNYFNHDNIMWFRKMED